MPNARGLFHVGFLKSVEVNGGRIEHARFSLQRGPLKFVEPIYMLTLNQQGMRSIQEFPWSPEVERYMLFDARRKMDDKSDEAERFAAILLNNIETAAETHGKDFTHAVLVELLAEREPLMQPLLQRAATARPSHNSRSYADSRLFLQHSLDGLHNSAIANLGYRPEEAAQIVREALAIVLDETFHISAADALFPRSHRSEHSP